MRDIKFDDSTVSMLNKDMNVQVCDARGVQ